MKLKSLILLPLVACALVGCNNKKSSEGKTDEQIMEAMLADPSLLLNPDGGLFERNTTQQLEGGDSLNAVKKYSYTTDRVDEEGNAVVIEPEVTWAFSDTNWTKKGYTSDPNRVLLVPEAVYDHIDEYATTLTLTMKWNGLTGTNTYKTYMNMTNITGTTYTLKEYRDGLSAGTIKNADTVITYGYITGSHEDVYSGVYIADGTTGLMLYAGKLSNCWTAYGLQVGDLVQVAGVTSPYNGLVEMKPTIVRKIEASKVGYTVAEPAYNVIESGKFNSTELKLKDGALVSMDNLTFVTIGNSTTGSIPTTHTNVYDGTSSTHCYAYFKDEGGNTVTMSLSYHLAERPEMAALFKTWTCDSTKINFKGHLTWYNAPQLAPVGGVACFTTAE